MFLSELPQEILLNISQYISLKDRDSCSYVCKAWKAPFQESMYFDLFVDTIQNLEKWCRTLDDPGYTKQDTGRILRSLHLGYCIRLTSEQLYTIQKTFPSIKSLYLQNLYLKPAFVGTKTDWSLWKSLTELRIDFYETHGTEPDNAFINTVSNLPLLRRLDLGGNAFNCVHQTFTMSDFELLHTRLIHLKDLRLSSYSLDLSESDFELMTEVLPAKKITFFSIISNNTDHRWLYYLARKYLNLEMLKFSSGNKNDESEEQRNDIISLLRSLAHPFQHLVGLDVGDPNYPFKEFLLFWELVVFLKIPLRHLGVYACEVLSDRMTSEVLQDLTKVAMKMCSSRFSETINELTFSCQKPMEIPTDLIKRTDVFRNLVN